MRNFHFERLDGGRLTVNSQFAALLEQHRLASFAALMYECQGEVAKNLLAERTTTRFELTDDEGAVRAFYIKRHRRPPWKEYVKPWLRLTRPILGAENEWQAILAFHECEIATMTPVALGRHGAESFLVTEGLEGCVRLSDWMDERLPPQDGSESGAAAGSETSHVEQDVAAETAVIDRLATIARRMHGSGLHHQDFYLTHFLVPATQADAPRDVHVIDLGRARQCRSLSRRWIIKDLAQLNYSASRFTSEHRHRFLERYLDRPLQAGDRPLLRKIERKTAAIARHSRRHRL